MHAQTSGCGPCGPQRVRQGREIFDRHGRNGEAWGTILTSTSAGHVRRGSRSMDSCDNPQAISAYHDGELPPDRARQLEQHLRQCDACRQELARLEALSGCRPPSSQRQAGEGPGRLAHGRGPDGRGGGGAGGVLGATVAAGTERSGPPGVGAGGRRNALGVVGNRSGRGSATGPIDP